MSKPLLLASSSKIRADLLRAAGLSVETESARVDESALREALLAEQASPRDIADALAEAKARKIAFRHPERLVLGCDQVLVLDGTILSKPPDKTSASEQLRRLRGRQHDLFSAAVLYEHGAPVWRHVSRARLTMRSFSDAYLQDYLSRAWPGIQDSVGGYKIEEEGVRLFARMDGDQFTILGLPLIELLNFLALRGTIPS